MKLPVTGGAGFIGSNFILYWMGQHPEDEIVNVDALTYAGNLENLKFVADKQNYKFIKADIRDGNAMMKAMQGIEMVIHFAAESHVDRSILEPAAFIETNVGGTQVLLDAALKNGVKRFHHVSSDEVFGALDVDSHDKFNENTPYAPRSPYSASKAGSDHLVRAYYITYGLPITITNCSNNFGPYHFPEKLIPLAITNVLEDKKIPIYGDGQQIRDWLYVEDHVRAIDVVLHEGKVGETYLVGGMAELIPNIEVARRILKLLGKDESYIEFVKDRPGHDRKYYVNCSKINRELCWKPLNSFDEWLEKTVQWYVENEEWWKNVKSGQYKEYYQKQYGS